MRSYAKFIVAALFVGALAMVEIQAQTITYEVRNCTDETWCVIAAPHNPLPPGCSPTLEACVGSNLLAANSVTTRTIDTHCYYLLVSQQPGNSPRITSFDPSGKYGSYCACWDYSGANPVLTIYQGPCSPPCPAPACP